jgi:hypothetical protein
MPYLPTNFGLLEPESSDYETSRVAVLPVPFERTTSYGKGTANGPAAILRASQSMELYDEELGSEPYRLGIATLPSCRPKRALTWNVGSSWSPWAASTASPRRRPRPPTRSSERSASSSSTPTPTCARSSRGRSTATRR